MPFPEELAPVIQSLNSNGVEYTVVGAVAVADLEALGENRSPTDLSAISLPAPK